MRTGVTEATRRGPDYTEVERNFKTQRQRPIVGRLIPTFVSQPSDVSPVTMDEDPTRTRSVCYVSELTNSIAQLHPDLGGWVDVDKPHELTKWLRSPGLDVKIDSMPCPRDNRMNRPDMTVAKGELSRSPQLLITGGQVVVIIRVAKHSGPTRTKLDMFTGQLAGRAS